MCELCEQPGGELLYRNAHYRVVSVEEADYPGFCRVIWNTHVREMTDLSIEQRSMLMDAVWRVEAALRDILQPDKINIASLGNMTPHLHWHLIPRYLDDPHFPAPIWAAKQRAPNAAKLTERAAQLIRLHARLAQSFAS